jgi:hypothetical protein
MILHIPLPKTEKHSQHTGYGETKEVTERFYFRIELQCARPWGSCGRKADGSLDKYRKGWQIRLDFTVCRGKVPYSLTYEET